MYIWLVSRLATLVIALLLAAAVFFAARQVLRLRKTGGCSGCSNRENCPHCCAEEEMKKR